MKFSIVHWLISVLLICEVFFALSTLHSRTLLFEYLTDPSSSLKIMPCTKGSSNLDFVHNVIEPPIHTSSYQVSIVKQAMPTGWWWWECEDVFNIWCCKQILQYWIFMCLLEYTPIGSTWKCISRSDTSHPCKKSAVNQSSNPFQCLQVLSRLKNLHWQFEIALGNSACPPWREIFSPPKSFKATSSTQSTMPGQYHNSTVWLATCSCVAIFRSTSSIAGQAIGVCAVAPDLKSTSINSVTATTYLPMRSYSLTSWPIPEETLRNTSTSQNVSWVTDDIFGPVINCTVSPR